MEAICKPDYESQVAAKEKAEKAKAKRKKERELAERARRWAEKKRKKWEYNAKETISSGDEEAEPEEKIPEVGYYDIYGVWFFGNITEVIQEIAKTKFDSDVGTMMHAFVDIKPDKITDGIHDVTVYGHRCRLYKWKAQEYHRGLIVLEEDSWGNDTAAVYMESGTWSWLLDEKYRAKLPPKLNMG
jgi:hypothetical protein